MEIVSLTSEMAEQFYAAGAPASMRGYAVIEDGKPIIIFGLTFEDHGATLFSETKESARQRFNTMEMKRIIIRAMHISKKMVLSVRVPVYSMAQPGIDSACGLLEHMGFEQFKERIYVWPHGSH